MKINFVLNNHRKTLLKNYLLHEHHSLRKITMTVNMDLYHGFDCTLETSTSMILAGPSNCGKSTFAVSLIQYRKIMYDSEISKIIIVSPHQQAIFQKLKENENVDILHELPDYEDIKNMADMYQSQGLILFLDDIMEDMAPKLELSKIFTQLCHHKQLTCILSVQNLFFQNNNYKNMALNCSYLVLFRAPGNKRQIPIIGSRMFPGKASKFVDSYEKATKLPYSYLFVDYRQKTRNLMRLKSDILPTDKDAMCVHMSTDDE